MLYSHDVLFIPTASKLICFAVVCRYPHFKASRRSSQETSEASCAVSGGRVGSVSCVSVADEMNSAVRQKLVKFI